MEKELVISFVIEEIVSFSINALIGEAKKTEIVLKIMEKFGLSDKDLPKHFDRTYALALIRYGVGKPKELVEIFGENYIKEAFKIFFETDNNVELIDEIQGAKEWHPACKKIDEIDIDLRNEIKFFTKNFITIMQDSRSVYEICLDKRLEKMQNGIYDLMRIANQSELPTNKVGAYVYHKEDKFIYFEKLRHGLRERDDFSLLSDSVNIAEALYAEGRLPDDLTNLLCTARAVFDEYRNRHGQITTAEAVNTLSNLKKVIIETANAIKLGYVSYHQRPIFELFQETQIAYIKCESEYVERILNKVDKILTDNPYYALTILQNELDRALTNTNVQIIDNKINEINQQIQDNHQSIQLFVSQNLSQEEYKILEFYVLYHYEPRQIANELQLSQIYVEIKLQKISEKLKIHFGLDQANTRILNTFLNNYWQREGNLSNHN